MVVRENRPDTPSSCMESTANPPEDKEKGGTVQSTAVELIDTTEVQGTIADEEVSKTMFAVELNNKLAPLMRMRVDSKGIDLVPAVTDGSITMTAILIALDCMAIPATVTLAERFPAGMGFAKLKTADVAVNPVTVAGTETPPVEVSVNTFSEAAYSENDDPLTVIDVALVPYLTEEAVMVG